MDMGGVVLQGSAADFIVQAKKILGTDLSHFSVSDVTFDENLNRGMIDARDCFATCFGITPTSEQLDELVLSWSTNWVARPEMLALILQLKKNGFVVAAFSNSDEINSAVYEAKGWYADFDHVFLSHEMGVIKPEMEMYELAMETLGVHDKECLLIDDQQANLEPAKELGMETILFTDYATLVLELKKRKLLSKS